MSDDIIKAGNGPQDGNDIDNADFDDAGGFNDDFGGGEPRGFKDLMQGSPIVKFGMIIGAIAAVVGAIVLFGGQEKQEVQSRVGKGRAVEQAPGEEVSESYQKAVEDFNIAEVEKALKQGDSALPVPVGTARGRVGLEAEAPAAEDPLERWRRIQEERQKRTATARPKMPTVDPNAEAVDALAKAMAGQMESVLSTKKISSLQIMHVTDKGWFDQQLAARNPPPDSEGDGAPVVEDPALILIPAGEVEYAQLLIEANSDAPGPVLAQLASGPLVGSRLLGSFKMEEEYLVLTFNQIVIDGVSHTMDGIALDPATTGIGVVTDVDHRYFTRVILPAAAKFVEGMAGAIAETGTSVTVSDGGSTEEKPEPDAEEELYSGMEAAAAEISEMMTDIADDTEIQVKVRAGTPVGILFLAPVIKREGGAVLAKDSGG